ncbi:MAG: GyrI-like domain-containing protein [Hyphomonadaceae bacterium]
MNDPVDKALWHIESRLVEEMNLDKIAAGAGVTRFVLCRQFAMATGLSVMRYVRARRLSLAACALAEGARDILSVALDAGYGSHEAFSRAFRDHFGMTPEEVREAGAHSLTLTEPKRMRTQTADLSEPRFETSKPLLLAGLSARYKQGGDAAIPLQWQRFVQHLGAIPNEKPGATYGVGANFDDEDSFDYMTCVEVSRFNDMPEGFATIRLPERKYAVFTHRGHVAALPQAMRAIWTQWLPKSGHQIADAPFFERYDQRFNPQTGEGEIELWLPIA